MHDRLVFRRIDALHQCFLVTVFVIVSLWCFTDATEALPNIFVIRCWCCIELRARFRASITGLSSPILFLLISTDRSVAVFLRWWFHIWRLFSQCVLFVSPSFGASGRLCLLTLAFHGYLHLYFCIIKYVGIAVTCTLR